MRKIYPAAVAVICVLLAVWLAAAACWIYLEGSARKAEDPTVNIYTPEIVSEKLIPALPLFFALAVLLAVGPAFRTQNRQYGKPAGVQCPVKRRPEGKYMGWIRAALIALAVILIIAGMMNGSARDVLIKAITICTECVGLG